MKYWPQREDRMWNEENIYTLGYCSKGLWADIGCGPRTLYPHMITVDNFSDDADIKAEMDKLPFEDGFLDGIYASHCLEHSEDILKTVEEWIRCVKVGGHIVIVYPDKRFVPNKGSEHADPQHKTDLQYEELREILGVLTKAVQVNKNITALPQWSFQIVLRRVK